MKNSPVALVTGSGSARLGRVIAENLGHSGYRLAIHYYHSKDGANLAKQYFKNAGQEAECFQADLSEETQCETLFQEVLARFGRIDAIVHTAAIWKPASLLETKASDLVEHLKVNYVSSFIIAQLAAKYLKEQAEGAAVVLLGDAWLNRPSLGQAAYLASKAGLENLCKILALELGSLNPKLRVNCLHPGPILLPAEYTTEQSERIARRTLAKRIGDPQELASAINTLVRNEYLSGQALTLDGGFSISS